LFDEPTLDAIADRVAERVAAKLSQGSDQQRLFDISRAAEYIGHTRKAVEHLIARGVVPVTRIDGKRQIDRSALDRVIDERTYYEAA